MTKEELIKLSRENLRKSKQGSLCECYDEAFIKGYELSKKRIAELEKENAELKSDNTEWEKASDKWKSVYELTNSQLTKAKEIIRELVDMKSIYDTCKEVEHRFTTIAKAEAFLNSEVEK